MGSSGISRVHGVPGKPGHPPVPVLASLWFSVSETEQKNEIEFTDPSGTLAAPTAPLNRWVELKSLARGKTFHCPTSGGAVYADMHDGDRKEVIISGSTLTIKPS